MIRKQCLIVVGDDPKVAPVFLGQGELEIAFMQSKQNDRRSNRIANAGKAGCGVDSYLLANRPIGMPAGLGLRREESSGDRSQPEGYSADRLFCRSSFRGREKRQDNSGKQ